MEEIKEKKNESDYIIIPNPLYDVVFRYLMEDMDSAMVVISTLINENIKKLTLEPLTHSEKKGNQLEVITRDPKTNEDIKLFHLDFTAIVELPDGTEEVIIIEVQKASEPGDIFRFKRYISKNFQKTREKEIINPKTNAIEKIDKPMRLIPIFILNFRIENEINDVFIKTSRTKLGVFKNKNLEKQNEFIDNLTYDIWVIQLPNLHNVVEADYKDDEYKQKVYTLLELFDQKLKIRDNNHKLRVIRKLFPHFLDRIIKRLQAADSNNPNLEEQMYVEDEYLKALINRDNTITYMQEELEKKNTIIEKKNTIILDYAKMLKTNGVSHREIQQKTGLERDMIEKL